MRVLDSTGRVLLEISDRTPKLISIHNISATLPTVTGSVAVSGMARDGTWMVTATVPPTLSLGQLHVYTDAGMFRWNASQADLGASGTYTFTVTVYRF